MFRYSFSINDCHVKIHYRLFANDTNIHMTAILAEVTSLGQVALDEHKVRLEYSSQSEEVIRPLLSKVFQHLCTKYFSFVVPVNGTHEASDSLQAFQAVLKNTMLNIFKTDMKK